MNSNDPNPVRDPNPTPSNFKANLALAMLVLGVFVTAKKEFPWPSSSLLPKET